MSRTTSKAKRPSRKAIQQVVAPALVAALNSIDGMEQDSTTLCRCIRALVETAFDLAECGGCPPGVMAEQLHRVARKRLTRMKSQQGVLMMKVAQA